VEKIIEYILSLTPEQAQKLVDHLPELMELIKQERKVEEAA
jgi:hypothetical protein